MHTRTQHSILIDTDPGDDVDDVIALAFAASRPEFSIKAITTVTGRTDLRAQLVYALLRTAGATDIPVGEGVPLPLHCTDADQRDLWMTPGGYRLNHLSLCTSLDRSAPVQGGLDLILETANAHAGELTIVCIGPLTNIASALLRDPSLAQRIRRIALMGGEPFLNRREHNISSDPHAANVVFTAGIPIFMGPWDVTRRVVLDKDECDAVRATGLPLSIFVADAARLWWPHKGGKPGAVVYDVSPLMWLLHPEWYTVEPMHLCVETVGEHTSGMVVRGSGEPNTDVAVDIDADAVKTCLMQTLLGG